MRIVAAFIGILFSLTAFSAEPNSLAAKKTYIEGKDYFLIAEPVRPVDPSKIEVSEVFSYICGHCLHFEPLVEAWIKKQPSDVSLVQIHTSWNSAMEPYQRGFYTAVTLKVKDKVQMAVFNAAQVEHKELTTAQAWADFLVTYGIDKQTTLKTYDSFGVTSQINQANARTRGYKTTGTPEIVVDGKYRVSASAFAGSELGAQQEMLNATQFLVDKVRAARGHR